MGMEAPTLGEKKDMVSGLIQLKISITTAFFGLILALCKLFFPFHFFFKDVVFFSLILPNSSHLKNCMRKYMISFCPLWFDLYRCRLCLCGKPRHKGLGLVLVGTESVLCFFILLNCFKSYFGPAPFISFVLIHKLS